MPQSVHGAHWSRTIVRTNAMANEYMAQKQTGDCHCCDCCCRWDACRDTYQPAKPPQPRTDISPLHPPQPPKKICVKEGESRQQLRTKFPFEAINVNEPNINIPFTHVQLNVAEDPNVKEEIKKCGEEQTKHLQIIHDQNHYNCPDVQWLAYLII